MQAWGPIAGFFSGLWLGVKSAALDCFKWIGDAVTGPLNIIKYMFSDVWSLFGGDGPQAEIIKTVRQTQEASPGQVLANTRGGQKPLGVNNPPVTKAMQIVTGVKARTNQSPVDNRQNHFAIYAKEGMDVNAIGNEVERRLDERERAHSRRVRGTYVDA